MITLEINGQAVSARAGEMLLKVIRGQGIRIPTLCHMDNLPPSGACRLCVVEVEGQRGLTPSCAYPVSDGMKVQTHSPRVLNARRTIVELLLSNHPDDCLYCVRNHQCDLQNLAAEFNISDRRFAGARQSVARDVSSPSIVRDPAKCILCGRCVRVCEEIQQVSAIDFIGRGGSTTVGTLFDGGLNTSTCINCGQCIMVCPTAALTEKDHIAEVMAALDDPDRFVVVQHAPSVSVTLGECFGLKAGADCDGIMTAALRRLGCDRVFDTGFTADLTIMEEASELAQRIREGGVLPMMTSCSPGWIKYVEQFYPEMLPNLSTCKSPQQMMGALVKNWYTAREGIDPERVFSVSIMPCTAKKFEAQRPEMAPNGRPDIDAVLTTRELARLLRRRGIDPRTLAPVMADTPFGERATAGKLFGASGGVMEAALRTAHHLLTGVDLEEPCFLTLRGPQGCKEATVTFGGQTVNVAVVNGLANAARLMAEIRGGRRTLHFVEVMTCPGGCVGGGGQPLNTDPNRVKARMQALYAIDRAGPVRQSHANPSVQRLYRDYLGEPLGERSHHLLHTRYQTRDVVG